MARDVRTKARFFRSGDEGECVKALTAGMVLIAIVVASALLDEKTGLQIWRELRADLEDSRARVDALGRENRFLRQEISALEAGPEALERAIREDLGLVRPGEIVVRFGRVGQEDLPGPSPLGSDPREIGSGSREKR